MLVLSRRIGEQIVIPSCDMTLKVIGINGTRVQLAISAPRSIVVHRGEISQHGMHRAEIYDDSRREGVQLWSRIEPVDLE
jgi:carbon storage regulator CsrA